MPGDYINSGNAAGCLIKARSPEDYVKYYTEISMDPPSLFFLYQEENVLPIKGVDADGQKLITYPEGHDIRVMDGKDPERLGVQFVEAPKKTYKWEALKNAKIKVKDKYLRDAEETAAVTVSWNGPERDITRTGDALSLSLLKGIVSKMQYTRTGADDLPNVLSFEIR